MELMVDGYKTLINQKDYEPIKHKNFSVRLGWNDTPYVLVNGKSLARYIIKTPKGLIADHKNNNTLDNRRINLRNATRSENMWNRKKTCGSSKYKGVHLRKKGMRRYWRAEIYKDNKRVWRKLFKNEKDAARAYNSQAKKLFGKFARLNEVSK